MTDHVVILMGLYNGARFLREQLNSFAAQTHRNWSLIVSDDGSTDAGPQLVRDFAAEHPHHDISLIDGPRQGFAQNFLSLLSHTGAADYVAFSDQDDIWLPDKLARAVTSLPARDSAALFCGRTMNCDESGAETGLSPLFTKDPSFANALVQSLAGGNTMVMSRAAVSALRQARPHAHCIVSHDWWAYQVLTGIGATVIYDPTPQLLYRQHGGNLIGSNMSFAAQLDRLQQVCNGRFSAWTDMTIASLTPIEASLMPENQVILRLFKEARQRALWHRLQLMRKSGIYRQTYLGTLGLWSAVFLGRV